MLYGNLIFIKKTGGDGSKYPVTEKNIKIGRSENCLIRILTPQVAPEHCQLIIDCNGQAKLRNLFTPTILNGKPLGQGDVTLCHGDVFKLGERLARWEYHPTSKYFKQLISPTGRLVAVVNPQRRSTEISGTSATQGSVSKSTPLGSKRKFSERFSSENSSMAKQRKTVGSDASLKPKIDLGKLLVRRYSIKIGKPILKTPTLKQRKTISGIINSRTPRNKTENHRKSALPSWNVTIDAGPMQSTQNKKSNLSVKTPSKQSLKNEVRTPSKSTPIKVKTPKRLKLDIKSGNKTHLNTILESPSKLESVRSTRSFSKSPAKVVSTPKHRSPVQAVRLVQSEKKSKQTPKLEEFGKMSLTLKKMDRSGRKSSGRKSEKEKKILSVENESQVQISSSDASNVSGRRQSSRKSDASFNSSKKTSRKSVKSKTPRNLNKSSNQSSVKKAAIEITQTPPLIDLSYEGDSVNSKQTFRESVISSRKSPKKSVTKSSARPVDILQTPQKLLKNAGTPSLEKTREEPSPLAVVSLASTPFGSRKPKNVSSSKKGTSSLKEKKASPRGVRRKLIPSISSAERAAKKLKTSSPKKPDKNKRAALLVLGKANRKQLLSQNVKVLLKQKIVKKAIKQSVALPIRKDEKKKTSVKKIKKAVQKEKKKSAKVSSPSKISQLVKEAPESSKLMEKSISECENDAANVKKSLEWSSLNRSKMSSPLPPAKLATPNSETVKSVTKSSKKADSILSPKSTNETTSPLIKFDKSSESYIFSSSRRCSKRLSSKNDAERPDFIELSPTALGLIPKNIDMFKTPKENKRKSSSLVTLRNIVATKIIKSASTSKIKSRKSVSFSSKDFSAGTTADTPTVNEKTDFDFDSFHTSNITMDVFVSPLNKSSATPVVEFVTDENVDPSEKRSTPGSKKVARKLLQSPQNDRASKSSRFSDETKTSKTSMSESGVQKPVDSSRGQSSPKNDLSDVRGVKKLFDTPKAQRSPKNDLSDLRGVKNLMQTPKVQKSPKNDLSDVRGVKKLMRTPKAQKSPKNDLSDLKGVKKLMRTPKVQKSPKNDLSDIRGVKKLMRTPKAQKSPKNDLSDVKGIKKLMQTPKVQKSPKNDLSDVRGVKELMGTRKVQKSPKNDLSDLRGVKKLIQTPKKQKSPKNELSDLRGIKRLLQSPRNQKSPKNDLTDVTGVKQLLRTPNAEESPQNNLSDVEGVKELFASPAEPISPSGASRKVKKTPKNRQVRKLSGGHEPLRKRDASSIGIAKLENLNSEKEEMEWEEKEPPGVSETKTKRGRKRNLDEGKNQKTATPKTRARKGSAKVQTPRVTRRAKQDAVEIKVSKREAVGGGQRTRAKATEPMKKTTRARAETKKEKEAAKAEASKTLRKRKTVEPAEATPPKVRRKTAAKQSTLKEPKTVAVRSAGRKGEAESSKKTPGKPKTTAKKAPTGQSKAAKSVSKTPKVQKGRSQTAFKQKSSKSGSISPRKTRAAAAKG